MPRSPGLFGKLAQIGSREFATPVDFNIERQTVILLNRTKARTLERRDVHKHIFTAIIALHKAKTLHIVEEFDRAIGTFAGRLALRSATIAATETATVATAITATETSTIAAAITTTVAIKAATFRTRSPLRHRNGIAFDHQIGCGHFATAINQREFQWLAFGKTRQACLFNCADMDENVIGLVIALDEAETFLTVEKLYDAFARSNDLCRHGRRARRTAAKSAATAAAETTAAATVAAATAAISAAGATTATAAAIITTTDFAGERRGFTETVVAKTITLVPAAATTLVTKTHVCTCTFFSPCIIVPCSFGLNSLHFPCIAACLADSAYTLSTANALANIA
jgi:hypothetical protein